MRLSTEASGEAGQMDAGCCHFASADNLKTKMLIGHREGVVEEQLISEAVSSTAPSPSIAYQLITTPPRRRRSRQSSRWLCRVTPINDNHVFRPPSSRPRRAPLHGLPASLASRGLVFSLSVPSIFIRGAAAPLLSDPTIQDCRPGRISIKHPASQPRSSWVLLWL